MILGRVNRVGSDNVRAQLGQVRNIARAAGGIGERVGVARGAGLASSVGSSAVVVLCVTLSVLRMRRSMCNEVTLIGNASNVASLSQNRGHAIDVGKFSQFSSIVGIKELGTLSENAISDQSTFAWSRRTCLDDNIRGTSKSPSGQQGSCCESSQLHGERVNECGGGV